MRGGGTKTAIQAKTCGKSGGVREGEGRGGWEGRRGGEYENGY